MLQAKYINKDPATTNRERKVCLQNILATGYRRFYIYCGGFSPKPSDWLPPLKATNCDLNIVSP